MAADCGGTLQTSETQQVRFVTNNGRGNGLDSGGGSTMTCYTPGTATYNEITRSVYNFGSNQPGGTFNPANYVNVTYKIATGSTGGGNWSYQFSNFIINVEADLDMFFRQVGGENHLIARLSNIYSYLVGPTQNIYYNFWAGLFVGANISYGLAVTTASRPPVEDSGEWRKCLGGWWSGAPIDPCSMGTCPPGESHIEPGGGTRYLWGRNQNFGSKFEHSGGSPARMDGPLEWDLGPITDFDNTLVYVYGRMLQGGDNNCNGAWFRGSTSYQGIAYKIPRIKVCPPELRTITQNRDICHNCAITDFVFEPNDLLGIADGTIIIEYVYNPPVGVDINWAKAESIVASIEKDTDIQASIPCLVSGSHYCWRAKIVVRQGSFVGESEYTYGCFDTLYIPEATWVVPDISETECQLLSRGGYVEQYEEAPSV